MLMLKPISSALAGLIIASVLSGCGGGDVEAKAGEAAAAVAATKAVEDAAAAAATKATAEAAVEAAKVAKAKAKAEAVAEAKAAAAAKAAPVAAAVPEVFGMPDVVGVNLQLAQDRLQALGSYLLDQEDAAGLNRLQVNDSNWKVCAQKPAPGKTVPLETMVLLTSVKLAEQCP
jgi:nucleoid-associated protein YgaU